jgi:hypothetical protein
MYYEGLTAGTPAFKYKAKNKAAFERFVQEMEGLLLEHYFAGDMDNVEGVSRPDDE